MITAIVGLIALVLEALEALLPPPERARLLPLLDDGSAATAHGIAESMGRTLPTFDEAVAHVLASGDTLTQNLLRGTLSPERSARAGHEVGRNTQFDRTFDEAACDIRALPVGVDRDRAAVADVA